jgi:hypothetical protein
MTSKTHNVEHKYVKKISFLLTSVLALLRKKTERELGDKHYRCVSGGGVGAKSDNSKKSLAFSAILFPCMPADACKWSLYNVFMGGGGGDRRLLVALL